MGASGLCNQLATGEDGGHLHTIALACMLQQISMSPIACPLQCTRQNSASISYNVPFCMHACALPFMAQGERVELNLLHTLGLGWVKPCTMNEWITSIQPPGLMKMRLMHHQEHHLGHQAPQIRP